MKSYKNNTQISHKSSQIYYLSTDINFYLSSNWCHERIICSYAFFKPLSLNHCWSLSIRNHNQLSIPPVCTWTLSQMRPVGGFACWSHHFCSILVNYIIVVNKLSASFVWLLYLLLSLNPHVNPNVNESHRIRVSSYPGQVHLYIWECTPTVRSSPPTHLCDRIDHC